MLKREKLFFDFFVIYSYAVFAVAITLLLNCTTK